MVIQALAETSITSSFDLSVLSLLGWDFGSDRTLASLYIDEAWLLGPFSMVQNCSALQPLLQLLANGAAGANTSTAVPAAAGGFEGLLSNCADTSAKRMTSVRAQHTKLPRG